MTRMRKVLAGTGGNVHVAFAFCSLVCFFSLGQSGELKHENFPAFDTCSKLCTVVF